MKLRWMFALAATLFGVGCAKAPDEAQVRAAIAAMQISVEQRDPREFMRHVATDFSGNQGNIESQQLHNLLRAQILRNERIGVVIGPIAVELRGERATADFSATLTGGASWLPERGAIYRIRSGWKREQDEWHCISAQWEAP
ncbi:MAG: hypothetical protein ABI411_06040 [Tahibacter sp.]